MKISIVNFETIDSTNTEALNRARAGSDEGLCIIARHQSAGRGRHGRVWVSEKDAGLYLSLVLRPRIEAQFLPLITLAAGVAVHETLSEFDIAADLKWVNDLLVNEKKIAGILAETTETKRGLAAVVGIGINLTHQNFPPEIAERATSIEFETGRAPDRERIIETLNSALAERYAQLSAADGPRLTRNEWAKRSTFASGKIVRVTMPDGIISGTTNGIEDNGALRIRTDAGNVAVIHAGDVEMIRA